MGFSGGKFATVNFESWGSSWPESADAHVDVKLFVYFFIIILFSPARICFVV